MTYVYENSVHKVIIGLLYGYKILTQLIALFLAFCVHNVKVKGLDDAKYIVTIVYIITINIVLVTMTFYVLKGYLNTHIAVFTLLVFFGTTVTLGLVFIPKVNDIFHLALALIYKATECVYTSLPDGCALQRSKRRNNI